MEDSELSFVLAHELAHSVARHSGEDLTKHIAVKAAGSLWLGGTEEELKKTANVKQIFLLESFNFLTEIGFRKPYSRIQENEADAIAVIFMKKAGLAPEESLAALEKLMGDEGEVSTLDKLFSTHPLTQDRIARIRQFLDYDAQNGEFLDAIQEDGQELALDWHAQVIQMLEDVSVHTRKVEGATDSLWFIPGIFMKDSENYLDRLAQEFPQSNLTVVEWRPASFNGEKMEYRARFFGGYLAQLMEQLLEKEGEKRENLVLVGHSLGSLAVAEACRAMNKKGEKVRQVVLMAAAIPYDCQELFTACEEASLEPPWNLYSFQDRALKYLYRNRFHHIALGFCGAEKKQARMKEFLLDSPETVKAKLKDISVSHGFRRYLKGFMDVRAGEIPETTVKYDFRKIAPPPKFMAIPIPRKGATVADSYLGWTFAYYLRLPKMPRFGKKDKPSEAPEAAQTEEAREDAEELPEMTEEKEEEWEDPPEDTTPEALEKARRGLAFVIFNPLGEVCFYSMKFDKAYEKFTEIRETLDKIARGEPYPQE
ncbi:MAG: M48 family metalloprotease [Oligosphaeraceae bacterium]